MSYRRYKKLSYRRETALQLGMCIVYVFLGWQSDRAIHYTHFAVVHAHTY